MLPSILSAAKGVASGLSSFDIDVTPVFNITNKTAGIPFIDKNTQDVYTPANNVLGASTATPANTGQTDLGFPTWGTGTDSGTTGQVQSASTTLAAQQAAREAARVEAERLAEEQRQIDFTRATLDNKENALRKLLSGYDDDIIKKRVSLPGKQVKNYGETLSKSSLACTKGREKAPRHKRSDNYFDSLMDITTNKGSSLVAHPNKNTSPNKSLK